MLLVAQLALGAYCLVDSGSGSLAAVVWGWLTQLHYVSVCMWCPSAPIQALAKRQGICHLSITSVCLELGACVFSRVVGGMHEILEARSSGG